MPPRWRLIRLARRAYGAGQQPLPRVLRQRGRDAVGINVRTGLSGIASGNVNCRIRTLSTASVRLLIVRPLGLSVPTRTEYPIGLDKRGR
jgi:hypothetical protein